MDLMAETKQTKPMPGPDPQALELRAAQHLEACPRDERYAVIVVVVDLATAEFKARFHTLPIPDVRQFWHDVLVQTSAHILTSKLDKLQ